MERAQSCLDHFIKYVVLVVQALIKRKLYVVHNSQHMKSQRRQKTGKCSLLERKTIEISNFFFFPCHSKCSTSTVPCDYWLNASFHSFLFTCLFWAIFKIWNLSHKSPRHWHFCYLKIWVLSSIFSTRSCKGGQVPPLYSNDLIESRESDQLNENCDAFDFFDVAK